MSSPPHSVHPQLAHVAAVEITRPTPCGDAEGAIERVTRRGASVEVDLLLSDGSDATAQLHVHDWDWLELRAGDIVPVRRLRFSA
jgi:hypothetical protein